MDHGERVTTEIKRLADPVALLEAMFKSAPVPLQIYEATGRSVLTNQAFRDLYGGEPPPEYNLFLDEVAARAGVTDLIRRAFAGEVITTPPHWYDPRELEHVRVPGGRRVGQVVTMTPLADRAGRIGHVAIFVRDVTSELEAQERTDAERRRLASLAETSAALTGILDGREAARAVAALLVPRLADLCALYVLDDADQLVRVIEAGADGATEDAMRALPTAPAVPGVPEAVATAFATGEVLHLPDYLAWVRDRLPPGDVYRDGVEAVRPLAGLFAPLRGRDRTVGVLGLGTTLASGRRFSAEDVALAGVLGERIGVALDNARLYSQLADENRINQTLVRLAESFTREHDEHQLLRLITDEASALIGAAVGAFELDDRPGPWPPGEPRPASYLAVPVIRRDGAVLGGLFFGHPEPGRFTAHHERLIVGIAGQAAIALESARLYEALRASDERARAAVRRKDEFLAILGHELRNPLAPIVTAIELMRRREGAGVVERERNVIERQVTHLSRLVDDLLDLSRITSGKVTLARRRIEVADVLAEAVERVSPLLESRRHQLKLAAPRGLVVDADFDRLSQVVTNLLHNAAKYTPEQGRLELTAARTGDRISIAIVDDGQGIERELLAAIFELFVQGEQDLQRAGGGLGVGLALVRHLITMHGGTVHADSAGRGQGSRFEVTLPAVTAAEPVGRDTEPTPVIAAAAGAGKRVLVVDDNLDAAAVLAEALIAMGHEVRTAADGVQALALARELLPEVAIVDIGLPVMDGYELAIQLRAALAVTPRLVALTGYGQDEDRARAIAAGFDEHLVKPASLEAVLRAIDG